MDWRSKSYFSITIWKLYQYFATMTVAFHDLNSLYGFFIFLVVTSQLISGTMLSFSLIPEPMIIPIVRDEEDLEDLYTDDFFWLHERGVDLIFIFSYLHLLRKLYIAAYDLDQEVSWKSGVFTFLIFQVVVFCGLVLCCTHLSEITLTIAANILHTFFLFNGKAYWWLFTDKTLNSDTVIRLAYAHYLSAFYMFYLALLHGLDLHYDWKNESSYDGLDGEMVWWDEAFSNELGAFLKIILLLNIVCWWLYTEPEALSYEIFMWGDIGLISDVRFYGVAPHWYFRPFMAWLIVCPHHKTGIFGLLYFFFALFHQPTLHGIRKKTSAKKVLNRSARLKNLANYLEKWNILKQKYVSQNPVEYNLFFQFTYTVFIVCGFYTSSFLPYGRFYNRLGGNNAMLISYMYLMVYLTFSSLRRPYFLDFFNTTITKNSKILKV